MAEAEDPLQSLAGAVRESGLVPGGSAGLVLVSGGADSAALAAGLVSAHGPELLLALHLNYELRPDSGEDEAAAARLADRLGIQLVVERPRLAEGNLQAEARARRYELAERLRAARGLDWIATGHTRTDLAETMIYRLAASPGRRALLGLPARRGVVIRPLLDRDREELRGLVERAGLPFHDDPSNAEPTYARNRIRHQVLPVLRELAPGAESNMAATQAELAEEAELLERLASEALERAGADAGGTTISSDQLAALDPALRRLALRRLAERAAGRAVALGPRRAAEIVRLAGAPEGGVIELGGGVEATVEHGHLRFAPADEGEPPAEAVLAVPGSCRFGGWELSAELRDDALGAGPETAVLDAGSLGEELLVRSWRAGDRMRPLGLDGTKSLQDLFTDGKVPRSLRSRLPVLIADGRIAWVAGVAVSEEFRASAESGPAAVITAKLVA